MVLSTIRERLDEFLADSTGARAIVEAERRHLPPDIAAKLDNILGKPSYREATLTQLAWSLAAPAPIDITQRQPGGRTTTAELKKVLEARHISARNAFENIGKNFPELRRGNEPDFDAFLNWANAAESRHRRSAFDYLLAGVSLIARPVAPMPELNRPRLTFVRVAGFLQSMLEVPSGGVHHQFIVTACLHAIIEEFGLGGPGGLRVETKNVAVSDASAGTAGDIQIMRGGRTEEALEVTANPWQSKIAAATRAARAADLARAHIVANAPPSEFTRIAESDLSSIDLSVLDVSAFVRTMVAVMKKPARGAALVRLYELLDRHQPDIERVNAYVTLLQKHGLAEQSS
jgi:hypothetical protein